MRQMNIGDCVLEVDIERTTTTSISIIGFAAKPGTEVLPTCSISQMFQFTPSKYDSVRVFM